MGRNGGGSDARRTRGDGQGVDLVRAVARMRQTVQAPGPGHKPRPKAQTTGPDHRPRPQAQTTGPGHRPRPQAQTTGRGHKPRPKAQTTGPGHKPKQDSQEAKNKLNAPARAKSKRARAHTRPRPRNLNAHARGSFWRARIILRVRRRKIFLGKGSKNRFPGGRAENRRGVKNATRGAGRGAASGKRAQKSTVLTHGAGECGIY